VKERKIPKRIIFSRASCDPRGVPVENPVFNRCPDGTL
jgi:hypothetical protein